MAEINTDMNKAQIASVLKRIMANIIDLILSAIASVVLLFPVSSLMIYLGSNDWIPYFVFTGIYFMVFESFLWKWQTPGRRLMNIKIETIKGEPLKPWISFLRYIFLCLPNYNGQISNLIARSIGITDTKIGGTVYLIIVGLLFSGNTLFLLFHKHKRGLHDILFNTILLKKESAAVGKSPAFTPASIIAGIAMFIGLSFLFGSMLGRVGKNPDFADVTELNERIKVHSPVKNINIWYRNFEMNGEEKWFAIQANVYIPYSKNTDEFKKELSSKLFPLIKEQNKNEKVTRIEIIYHAKKFWGAFPVSSKSNDIKEIEDIGT